jgi:serine phosphatase RsbU (regulator of sigma subunit)
MLPDKIPGFANLDIAVHMETATEVGGDYYDFMVQDDKTLIAAVGDATGHGMKAGTMVSIIKGFFYFEEDRFDILSFLEKCSAAIKHMNLRNLYMGLTIVKIKGSRMLIASAGMPPVYIYRGKNKSVERIAFKSIPLGSSREFSYRREQVDLKKGDTILLLSDGLPELFDEKGDIFSYSRVEAEFAEVAHLQPQKIINHLVNAGKQWNRGKPPDDDITLMAIKVLLP